MNIDEYKQISESVMELVNFQSACVHLVVLHNTVHLYSHSLSIWLHSCCPRCLDVIVSHLCNVHLFIDLIFSYVTGILLPLFFEQTVLFLVYQSCERQAFLSSLAQFCRSTVNEEQCIAHKLLGEKFQVHLSCRDLLDRSTCWLQ